MANSPEVMKSRPCCPILDKTHRWGHTEIVPVRLLKEIYN